MKRIITATLLFATAYSSVDYHQSGTDWNGTCEEGLNQSPIDIPTHLFPESYEESEDMDQLVTYNSASVHQDVIPQLNPHIDFYAEYEILQNKTVLLTDHGKSIKVDLSGSGALVFKDEKGFIKIYEVLQMHFHAPAEHTFDAQTRHHDLELHIVHSRYNQQEEKFERKLTEGKDDSQSESLAVIAIFFDVELGGNALNPFIESLNMKKLIATNSSSTDMTTQTLSTLSFNLNTLVSGLKKEQNMYHYAGSLTTPPCSQSVAWLVVDDPQPITPDQLLAFQMWWQKDIEFAEGKGNNRAVQSTGQRTIFKKVSAAQFGLIASATLISLIVAMF